MPEIISASDISSLVSREVQVMVWRTGIKAERPIRVLALGDIGFSGRIGELARFGGHDAPLAMIAPLLRQGDIIFGNLETPLLHDALPGASFAAATEAAPALARAGFTHLHLANNHIIDYGAVGLASTITALELAGIIPLGVGETREAASKLVVSDVNGFSVGWLACGHTLRKQENTDVFYCEYDSHELLDAVKRQRQSVDLLIISLHIGLMYLDYPDPAHQDLAQQLVETGADLVLMHHAHVLQGVEFVDNKFIAYCLGNALWDWQEGHVASEIMVQERQESALFVIDWSPTGVSQVAAIPIYADEYLRVQWATGVRGQRILARLERISRDLSTGYEAEFAKQRASRNVGHTINVLLHHLKRGQLGVVARELRQIRPAHIRLLLRYAQDKFRHSRNV